jgi:hypothetical protein
MALMGSISMATESGMKNAPWGEGAAGSPGPRVREPRMVAEGGTQRQVLTCSLKN